MVKSSDTDWPTPDGHPSEDELLLYVDGELATKEARNMRAHLEACWSCRVRTEKIQEAISSFIDYRNNVLKPLIDPPPHGWRGFDKKLGLLAAESGKRAPFSNVFSSLGRFSYVGHLFGRPLPVVRTAAGILVVCLVIALAIRFKQESTVSASVLLKNATEAQATQIRATAQPVVYQKLQVRRKDLASSRAETVHLEIWNDTANSRFRQSLTDGGARQFISLLTTDPRTIRTGNPDGLGGASIPAVLAELEQVLRANHLDPQRPLSATSYQAWRNSLGQKQEEVTRTLLPDGLKALTLRTTPAGQVGVGQIAEAALVVRAKDWHPVEQRLRVRSEGGDRVYELTETVFEVVSLPALSAEIFSEPKQVAATPAVPTASPSAALKAGREPLHPSAMIPPFVAATADLEVEVLRLLNQAGADLGEQIEVRRMTNGPVVISGVVETPERKNQIIIALHPVSENPAVRIQINTVAEALALQKPATAQPKPSVEKVEVESNTFPAEADLRAYFHRQGKDSDESVRQFAARITSRSSQAMNYLWAMKRLKGQFSPAQLQKLTPEARSKWLNVIRLHARSYQNEIATLKRELQPVFGVSAGTGDGASINSDAELLQTVDRLFEAGSGGNQIVRQEFTTSSQASTNALKTHQFWRMLNLAEALAAAISQNRLR